MSSEPGSTSPTDRLQWGVILGGGSVLIAAAALIFAVLTRSDSDLQGQIYRIEARIGAIEEDKEAERQSTQATATAESRIFSLTATAVPAATATMIPIAQTRRLFVASLGIIGDEYVGKPTSCPERQTGAQLLYAREIRIISVAQGLKTEFPCGSTVSVCRVDQPLICSENVLVADTFPDAGERRTFNASPAIGAELGYDGPSVVEVTVEVTRK